MGVNICLASSCRFWVTRRRAETQRRTQLQGESPLSPGQAERGRKALLCCGPRLANRPSKRQLTLEAQQFGTVDELSPMVGTRQPLIDCGTGFGNLSEPYQAFHHGAREFRVPDRPASAFAELQFGAQQRRSLREFTADDQQFPPQASPKYSPERSTPARCDFEQHRYRLVRGLQITCHQRDIAYRNPKGFADRQRKIRALCFLQTEPSLIHGLIRVPLEPKRPRQHRARQNALVKLTPGRQTPICRRDIVPNDVFGALPRLLMLALHLQNETAQALRHQTR